MSVSDSTFNLSLPLLMASQTQKHVTLNEGLVKLDNLVMLAVLTRGLASPPALPNEGDKFIIAANPLGEWAGKANKIAAYNNLGWDYYEPKQGFVSHIIDENIFLYFDGSNWRYIPIADSSLQNLATIGVGTGADSNNPLAAKLNNALFTAKYSTDGGNGDIRFKLNKESIAKNASFLFQNNWSGRAEFGLCGDDNFSCKVSSDGLNWKTAINIDKNTGKLNILGATYPAYANGNNEIISLGNTRFLHSFKPNSNDGLNTFIGLGSGNFSMASGLIDEASRNTGIGAYSLQSLTTGYVNTAVGSEALLNNTTGNQNTAVGRMSLVQNVSGSLNSSIGAYSMFCNTTGSNNCAVGRDALSTNISGSNNSALGYNSIRFKIDGTNNSDFSNCTGIGSNTRVSASNQLQLGDSSTTVYAYGAVQNRSDLRDKADIRDTILGLDFIKRLRPVDFKWDLRDDYLIAIPNNSDDENNQTIIRQNKDGSKKRNRYHHGLIAQEVEELLMDLEIDFGGFQKHSKNGGNDVLTIGYSELIAPIIKSIQELNDKINRLI